jgi:threonine/homoserine/homoserine lactone efflux protein
MTFESWAAFTAASTVLLIIPGPTVLLVVSYALGQGWRTALPMAVGVALGDFTAMTLSLAGPSRIAKLTLVDSSDRGPPGPLMAEEKMRAWRPAVR